MSKVVLIVGHSQEKQGATNGKYSFYGEFLSEYNFNKKLIEKVVALNEDDNLELIVEERDNGYAALPSEVNSWDADLAVSFHLNGFSDKNVDGCEVLHFEHSKRGLQTANILLKHLHTCVKNNNRGVDGRDYNKAKGITELGAYIMKYTRCVCNITEPFFISNDEACEWALMNMDKLAQAYLDGIVECVEYLNSNK